MFERGFNSCPCYWLTLSLDCNKYLLFVSADASGSVKVWHVPTMNCLSSTQEGSRQVLACAFNASASQYVTAGSDTTINLYDANTRQKLFSLEPRYVMMVMMPC